MNRINNAKTNALNMWKNQAEARRQLANDYITQQNNKAKADYDAQQEYFKNKMALAENNRTMVVNDITDRTSLVYTLDYIDKQIKAYEHLRDHGELNTAGRAQVQKQIDDLEGQKASLNSKMAILNRRIGTMSESALIPTGTYMETPEVSRGTLTADDIDFKEFQRKIGVADDGVNGPKTKAAAKKALDAGDITQALFDKFINYIPPKQDHTNATPQTKLDRALALAGEAFSGWSTGPGSDERLNNARSTIMSAAKKNDINHMDRDQARAIYSWRNNSYDTFRREFPDDYSIRYDKAKNY